ncbi:hypothetical protein NDU88_003393 [Pleurodeles waltl]|uniref:Uncharacterized protein n=1 Tax=Pleurodeles waltl TaxID=8319 RepID=A0AAV7KY09_PLEWA|nr:hypothetical protein NDU88_003393 [Pleurodeles waltl]
MLTALCRSNGPPAAAVAMGAKVAGKRQINGQGAALWVKVPIEGLGSGVRYQCGRRGLSALRYPHRYLHTHLRPATWHNSAPAAHCSSALRLLGASHSERQEASGKASVSETVTAALCKSNTTGIDKIKVPF